jgi:ribosome maturation factor RimP
VTRWLILATFFIFWGAEAMGIAEEIEARARPLVESAGLDLVHVQFRTEENGWILRCFIDKTGGFGLKDCEEWNDRLGQLVEESGLISHPYSLEVSSPGLDRPLKKKEDFERFKGIDAVVKTAVPLNNQRNFHGRIEGLDGEKLVLLDRTNGLVWIPLADVSSAKLDPSIPLERSNT